MFGWVAFMVDNRWLIPWAILLAGLAVAQRGAIAHKIEISGTVGATLHLEPNDTAKAGEPVLAWFAPIEAGGKVIPLSQCDCTLQWQSRRNGAIAPPTTVPLQPKTVEGYREIPAAEIVFPQPGLYALTLAGTPKGGRAFQPFSLTFEVAVTAGPTARPTPASASPPARPRPPQAAPPTARAAGSSSPSWLGMAIGTGVGLAALGAVVAILRQ